MEVPRNPFKQQLEKSKNQIMTLAFVMGAFPFLLMMLFQVAI